MKLRYVIQRIPMSVTINSKETVAPTDYVCTSERDDFNTNRVYVHYSFEKCITKADKFDSEEQAKYRVSEVYRWEKERIYGDQNYYLTILPIYTR